MKRTDAWSPASSEESDVCSLLLLLFSSSLESHWTVCDWTSRKHREGSSGEKASNPSKRHGGLRLRSLDSSLISLRPDGTRASALGVDSPLVVEQPSEGVDLSEPHAQHDQHVDTGPEGDPPQVVLQQVSVASLEGPQDRLHLTTALQPPVDRLHRLLPQEGKQHINYLYSGLNMEESFCHGIKIKKR